MKKIKTNYNLTKGRLAITEEYMRLQVQGIHYPIIVSTKKYNFLIMHVSQKSSKISKEQKTTLKNFIENGQVDLAYDLLVKMISK